MKRKQPALLFFNLKSIILLIGVSLLFTHCTRKAAPESKVSASWALLPFVKADSVNPILSAGQNSFTSGQALFDKNDPSKLIDRLEKNFLMPDKPYETTGQVNQVCFIEGMGTF